MNQAVEQWKSRLQQLSPTEWAELDLPRHPGGQALQDMSWTVIRVVL